MPQRSPGCAAASLALAPISFAETVTDGTDNGNHVTGEKLDSGLGELASDYDAVEYNAPNVAGEKLDSGLGELCGTMTLPSTTMPMLPGKSSTVGWAR